MYVNQQTKDSITAEVLLDSINSKGQRLTTAIIQIPRIVLAEFNTHRKLSRNSASSRAIPFEKMVNQVISNPFIPMAIQKNHKGMQGTEYLNQEEYENIREIWMSNLDDAIAGAVTLNEAGITKQLSNRLLEPFMYHKILVTSTSFDNFTALRNHEAAEIHIAEAARKLTLALNNSAPKYLNTEQLHLPFIKEENKSEYLSSDHFQEVKDDLLDIQNRNSIGNLSISEIYLAMISAGKCARVSYNNFDGTVNHGKDYDLAANLVKSGHWSPMEHQAIVSPYERIATSNLCASWKQFRTLFINQNLVDPRINKY